jgi:hypothetical protein
MCSLHIQRCTFIRSNHMFERLISKALTAIRYVHVAAAQGSCWAGVIWREVKGLSCRTAVEGATATDCQDPPSKACQMDNTSIACILIIVLLQLVNAERQQTWLCLVWSTHCKLWGIQQGAGQNHPIRSGTLRRHFLERAAHGMVNKTCSGIGTAPCSLNPVMKLHTYVLEAVHSYYLCSNNIWRDMQIADD